MAGMGSYNYEALHRHTPGVQRAWMCNNNDRPGAAAAVESSVGFDHITTSFRPEPYGSGGGLGHGGVDVNGLSDATNFAVDRAGLTNYAGGVVEADRNAHAHAGTTSNFISTGNYVVGTGGDRFVNGFNSVVMESERCGGNGYGNVYGNGNGVHIMERMRDFNPPQPTLRRMGSGRGPSNLGVDETPLPGMIFGCTTETYQECMRLQLFGLPPSSRKEVKRVVPGTKLFLYNYRERELSGIFEATSHGDLNIVPDAFLRWGSFPAQVRIRCVDECPNLGINAFKPAMIDNFEQTGTKFKYPLSDDQVHKLIDLFRKEADYWQRRRGFEPPPPRFQQVQSWPRLQQTFQNHNHERQGKGYEALTKQPHLSNNGHFQMAGATAPANASCSRGPRSPPPIEEDAHVLRPLRYGPLKAVCRTPKAFDVLQSDNDTLLGKNEAKSSIRAQMEREGKGDDSIIPSRDKIPMPSAHIKHERSSSPIKDQSIQGCVDSTMPVLNNVCTVMESTVTISLGSHHLHKENPTRSKELAPLLPEEEHECSKPGEPVCVTPTPTGECETANEAGDEVNPSAGKKHSTEDGSVKPKSRKKMKASKTRSNVMGNSLFMSPAKEDDVSSLETIKVSLADGNGLIEGY